MKYQTVCEADVGSRVRVRAGAAASSTLKSVLVVIHYKYTTVGH